MAIPSGSGTEVLKRTTINNQSNDATAFRWDGTMATVGTETYTVPANHIITVLSIIICEQGNAAESANVYMHDGANNHQLLQSQALSAYSTFIWNDRFILTGGDKLIVNLDSSGSVDFICSFIDQDWT
tara:strand:- start:392 stop:775 length:384 start_codon:yes stop_codon:yes gene_type:complete